MLCAVCHLPLEGRVCVLRPCGHLVHGHCSEHISRLPPPSPSPPPPSSSAPTCGRCGGEVHQSTQLFLAGDDDAHEQPREQNGVAALQRELYGQAVGYAKAKARHEALTAQCAQLHQRKLALQQRLQESFGPAATLLRAQDSHLSGRDHPLHSAVPRGIDDMDPVALQVYIAHAARQHSDVTAQLATKRRRVEALSEQHRELKGAQRSRRAARDRPPPPMSVASSAGTALSGRDEVIPTRRRPVPDGHRGSPPAPSPPSHPRTEEYSQADVRAPAPSPVARSAPSPALDVDAEPEVVEVDDSAASESGSSVVVISGPRASSPASSRASAEDARSATESGRPEAAELSQCELRRLLPPRVSRTIMPQMGLSLKRSLRDIPRPALHQTFLL